MWWQNFKVQLIVLLIVILIAVIIFCSVCFSTSPPALPHPTLPSAPRHAPDERRALHSRPDLSRSFQQVEETASSSGDEDE